MYRKLALLCSFFLVILLSVNGLTASSPAISITGSVKQPLNLTMEDLRQFKSVSVRLNEVTTDRNFHGAFSYLGVPLRTVLEPATVQKEETDFSKAVDLAIVVKNKEGKQTVLSWGEVFYRNPAEVIIAVNAAPVMPHRECSGCHTPEVFKKWFDPLKRQVGLPKLVVANDFYTDRSLEDVSSIEIINLHPKMTSRKLPNLFSPEFIVTGAVKKDLKIGDLSSYPRLEILAKQVGDGKGYHGLKHFGGSPLIEIVRNAGVDQDLNNVFLISAPDGYRSLISYGEMFLSSYGRNIIIADMADNQPLKENGKFIAVLSDDLSADRWVKAVDRIEVISLKQKPKLYIIGVGCADASLITLEAVSHMGKSAVFLCADDIKKRFAKYMGDKPVLFNPLQNAEPMFKKNHPELSPEEGKRLLEEQRARDIQKIRDALREGKNVAFLEYGDPTIFGSWIYWLQEFQENIEIIPGISAFNAANALIEKHIGCNGSIILSVPRGLQSNEPMLKAIAENGDTLAIFIGLKEMENLMPLFKKYYPGTTQVNVVYRAGYSGSRRLIRTTLNEVLGITEKENEKHLGMIYIGPCLK